MQKFFNRNFLLLLLSSLVVLYLVIFALKNSKKTEAPSIENLTINALDIQYGSDTAQHTIYMFADYNCTYCKHFFLEAFSTLQKEYIETGKLRFVLKLLNNSNSPNLKKAYQTAVCLNQYGDYSQLHKLLVMEPQIVSTAEFDELVESYISRNSNFAECMLSGEAEEYLVYNKSKFYSLNLKATPTFVINNRVYVGYKNWEHFQQILYKEGI